MPLLRHLLNVTVRDFASGLSMLRGLCERLGYFSVYVKEGVESGAGRSNIGSKTCITSPVSCHLFHFLMNK